MATNTDDTEDTPIEMGGMSFMLGQLTGVVASLERRMDSIEKRMDRLEDKIDRLDTRLWGILAAVVVGFVAQTLFQVMS